MTVTLIDKRRGNEKEFDSRSEAEEKRNDIISMGADPEDLVIEADQTTETDASNDGANATMVDHTEDTDADLIAESDAVPSERPTVDENPVDWMPSHFVDRIQGQPTVNRKGYAVIASQFDVSVVAEPVTLASETDFEYAEFRAVATTADGTEYSGMGSAHVDRDDGDGEHILNELAETRAMKRATA